MTHTNPLLIVDDSAKNFTLLDTLPSHDDAGLGRS